LEHRHVHGFGHFSFVALLSKATLSFQQLACRPRRASAAQMPSSHDKCAVDVRFEPGRDEAAPVHVTPVHVTPLLSRSASPLVASTANAAYQLDKAVCLADMVDMPRFSQLPAAVVAAPPSFVARPAPHWHFTVYAAPFPLVLSPAASRPVGLPHPFVEPPPMATAADGQSELLSAEVHPS
jgi:hypothetical protein